MVTNVKELKSVFISYSSKDTEIVNEVVNMLEASGISYWKAPEMIPAGSNYAKEIPRVICECDIFLLIISEDSQRSIWVEKEIDFAINNRKVIVPLKLTEGKLTDMFSFYLNNVQMVNYNGNLKKALKVLRTRIETLLPKENLKGNTRNIADGRENSNVREDKNGEEIANSKENSDNRVITNSRENLYDRKIANGREIANNREIANSNNRELDDNNETASDRNSKNIGSRENSDTDIAASENKEENSEIERANRDNIRRSKINAFNYNPQPEFCRKCNGKLKEIAKGVYKCMNCGMENYDYFQTVRNYLEKAGPCSIIMIEKATKVPRASIDYFIKNEMLEIPKNSDIRLRCKRCGAPIRSGYLCDVCKKSDGR